MSSAASGSGLVSVTRPPPLAFGHPVEPLTWRWNFFVGEEQSVNISPFLLVRLSPGGVFSRLELLLLVCADITRRNGIHNLAAREQHLVFRQLPSIAESPLASLAVRLVMFAVEVLPIHRVSFCLLTHGWRLLQPRDRRPRPDCTQLVVLDVVRKGITLPKGACELFGRSRVALRQR